MQIPRGSLVHAVRGRNIAREIGDTEDVDALIGEVRALPRLPIFRLQETELLTCEVTD
jgi:hypothetical protein